MQFMRPYFKDMQIYKNAYSKPNNAPGNNKFSDKQIL